MKTALWSVVLIAFGAAHVQASDSIESEAIAAAVQPYIDQHKLIGAVTLVASKDRTLSLQAFGYSDLKANKLMKTDAIFWIASMSKTIVGTAMMMLVNEGKVRLDDPVEKYLPEFTPSIIKVSADGTRVNLQKARQITIRQLLSHTSGVSYGSSIETPTLDVFPLSVRVQSYAMEPLMFEPGADWMYSDAGVNTAGRIIEVVSGMPYDQFVQERLFGPLGMVDTTFWPTAAQLQRLAKAYKPNAAGDGLEETSITFLQYPLDDRRKRFLMPAGGLFSTAHDLGRFCQMILAGGQYEGRRYLSRTSVAEMTRNQVGGAARKYVYHPGDPDGYGLGWSTDANGGYGHDGAYLTSMRIDPKRGLVTVWLIQQASFTKDGAKIQEAFEEAAAKSFSPVSVASVLQH